MTGFPFNFLFLTSLVFVINLVSVQNAWACSCQALETPYQAYKDAKAVFVGKVVGAKDASGKEIIQDKLSVSPDMVKGGSQTDRYYHFEVEEWLKGTKSSKIEVATSINMCEFGFDLGDRFIVYAYESKGILRTSLFCSRTAPVDEAQDVIHFLRDFLKSKPEPRIYGSVRLGVKALPTNSFKYTFLEGIKIVAQSENKRFEAVTDKNGLYRFYEIPNEKYKIYLDLPKEYITGRSNLHEITLQDYDELNRPEDPRTLAGRNVYSNFFFSKK